MEAVQGYILSIIAAAMLCSLLSVLFPENSAGKMAKLLCRIFLTITIIRPFAGSILPDIQEWIAVPFAESQEAVLEGQELYQSQQAELIKQKTEAYIVDKATASGVSICAEVGLGEELLPQEVVITGSFFPEQKTQLQAMLEQDLGISKERQIWISKG